MKETYTNMDYRNAKIIRIVKKEQEHYLYKKQEITKEEAISILKSHSKKKEHK